MFRYIQHGDCIVHSAPTSCAPMFLVTKHRNVECSETCRASIAPSGTKLCKDISCERE